MLTKSSDITHQVRSRAQNVLFSALGTYNFCCRDLIPHVLEFLVPDRSSVTQQQFKVGLVYAPAFAPRQTHRNHKAYDTLVIFRGKVDPISQFIEQLRPSELCC